jgi:penicillin-binding protein-related factor A (putative recombinase)
VNCVPIPDSGRRVTAKIFIQTKSPFDYCIAYQGRSAHIDTKTTEAKNFTWSMIDMKQVNCLMTLACGGPAGYVIGFSESVYFVPVQVLMVTMPGGHVDLERGICLGDRNGYDVRLIFKL